jgi:hypothetical protein
MFGGLRLCGYDSKSTRTGITFGDFADPCDGCNMTLAAARTADPDVHLAPRNESLDIEQMVVSQSGQP